MQSNLNDLTNRKSCYFMLAESRRKIGLNLNKSSQLFKVFLEQLYGLNMRKYPKACITEVQFNDTTQFTKCCGTNANYNIIAFPAKFSPNYHSNELDVDCDAQHIDECHTKILNGECKCSIVNNIIGPYILPNIYKGK